MLGKKLDYSRQLKCVTLGYNSSRWTKPAVGAVTMGKLRVRLRSLA